jgi:hypothetical protein
MLLLLLLLLVIIIYGLGFHIGEERDVVLKKNFRPAYS